MFHGCVQSDFHHPKYLSSFLPALQDFGLRVGGDLASPEKTGKTLDMPTTTSKPTTTTDRLPINPDGILSHIALEVSQSINPVTCWLDW